MHMPVSFETRFKSLSLVSLVNSLVRTTVANGDDKLHARHRALGADIFFKEALAGFKMQISWRGFAVPSMMDENGVMHVARIQCTGPQALTQRTPQATAKQLTPGSGEMNSFTISSARGCCKTFGIPFLFQSTPGTDNFDAALECEEASNTVSGILEWPVHGVQSNQPVKYIWNSERDPAQILRTSSKMEVCPLNFVAQRTLRPSIQYGTNRKKPHKF